MEDSARGQEGHEDTDADSASWPEGRDPDQWWFWTEKWQQMEREADEDIAAGNFIRFESGEEFLAYLERIEERQ